MALPTATSRSWGTNASVISSCPTEAVMMRSGLAGMVTSPFNPSTWRGQFAVGGIYYPGHALERLRLRLGCRGRHWCCRMCTGVAVGIRRRCRHWRRGRRLRRRHRRRGRGCTAVGAGVEVGIGSGGRRLGRRHGWRGCRRSGRRGCFRFRRFSRRKRIAGRQRQREYQRKERGCEAVESTR